jgi:hypothetical protein
MQPPPENGELMSLYLVRFTTQQLRPVR